MAETPAVTATKHTHSASASKTARLAAGKSSFSVKSLSAAAANQLTVLVFKDGSAARTFRIPLRWIHQFGWLLGVMVLTVLLSLGIAVKSSLFKNHSQDMSSDSSLGRVQELESQLKDARDKIQSLSATTPSVTNGSPVAQTTAPEQTDLPIIDPKLLSNSTPVESRPYLFKALPDEFKMATDIPIVMGAPSARWNGKSLVVKFNLQYTSKTPGGQQGRIVVLARGPGTILTHPADVLQNAGKDVLIDPNRGEYFSVSRFREARADFGPISNHDAIKEVEVLIVGSGGQLLIHQVITPGAAKAAAPTTAKPQEDPGQ